MNTFVHFEITASDTQRAARFYQQVLGWQVVPYDDSGVYLLCTTHADNAPGIDGAIMRRGENQHGTINTTAVDSLEETLKLVLAAGGRKIGDTQHIPGVGLFSYCEDTEGNLFGILQPEGM